ncbi:MAG: MMPL family transporter [Marichromatium sp.]|uniref:efflux RND transporter permease subunit n=1 Tax=Marichromatium sp. PS1 TaxID=3138932 RepID=UPI001B17841B|nr:MMPL family transporter [Marichromatium sp.]
MLRIERVNLGFRRLTETLLRRRLWVLLGVGLCLGAAVSGIGGLHSDVDPDNWLLEDDAMRQDHDHFERIFGNSDYCAVLIEHEDVFSPEVLRGIRALGTELERRVPHADEVLSLTDLEFMLGSEEGLEITELVPEPVPESAAALAEIRALAMSRPSIRDRLVSADGTQTWVMLRLHGYGEVARSEGPDLQVGRSCSEIAAQPEYAFMRPQVSGLPAVNYEKKRFFNAEAPRLLGISLLVSALILAVTLRSVWGVLFPLLTAAAAMAMVLGVQGHLGVGIDPSLVFLPLFLGMAVSIGYSIHVINHFRRRFLVTGARRAAILHALEETGWPLLFTALTTAAAMLSFLLIPLQPIHWIGYTAASLVLVTWALVVLVLPVLLSFGRDRAPAPDAGPGDRPRGRALERLLGAFGGWVLRRPRAVIAVFLLLTLGCVAGLSQFRVSFDYRETMGLQVPYIARMNAVAESEVGSLYAYDLAIAFDAPDKAREPANLAKLDQLREEILGFPLTKRVTSLNLVVKDLHQAVFGGGDADYRLPEDRQLLAQLLLLYENAGGTEAARWVDYDYQRLRMMIEVSDYDSEEAERELERIRARAAELFPDAKVYLIGSIAQYTYMMHQVTWGQLGSFMVALVIIGGLMMVVFGGVRIGLIAMIPNVAPALAVGGAMGWSGIPMDIMTVTIMPMLLGLAVDDSIHFIAHARLEHQRTGGDYVESIRRTFTSVGVALVLTSVVLVLNFSVYLASTVNMFVHMGALVALGIGAALLTDFFVTPVLLERLRPFDPRSRRG